MKRIIPLLLILALIVVQLPSFLAVPVKAAEVAQGMGWVDLLDYGYPVGYSSNMVQVHSASGSVVEVTYNFPSSMMVQYVDILVNSYKGDWTVSYTGPYGSFPLDVSYVFGDYFRITGNIRRTNASSLTLVFDFKSADWVNFISFRVSAGVSSSGIVPMSMNGLLDDGRVLASQTYNSSSGTVHTVWDGTTAYTPLSVFFQIDYSDWIKYDFIEIKGLFQIGQISSIIAYHGKDLIPCDVNFISDASIDINYFYVGLTLDLRNLNRAEKSNILINILGNEYIGSNSYSIISSAGFISFPNDDPYLYYFKSIITSIDSAADKIVSAFSSGMASSGVGETVKQEAQQKADQLSSGVSSMGSLKKPDSSSVGSSGNLGSVIGSADIISGTHVLTTVMEVPLFAKIITLALIFTLAAYVLFGKRG